MEIRIVHRLVDKDGPYAHVVSNYEGYPVNIYVPLNISENEIKLSVNQKGVYPVVSYYDKKHNRYILITEPLVSSIRTAEQKQKLIEFVKQVIYYTNAYVITQINLEEQELELDI